MMKFSHPTMINFLGFSNVDFSKKNNITLIMDLAAKGSLYNILEDVQNGFADKNYDNTARQIILVGISYGMMQLHQNRVIHRDLKPGNILIDDSFFPHITDFGLSKIYQLGHSKSQSKECGTPCYMAPEVIRNDPYGTKADVYSFAIIMYEVITDMKPYPLFERGDLNVFRLYQKITDEYYRPQFTVPINPHLKKLIEECWSGDPDDRHSFEKVFLLLAYDQRYYLNDVDVNKLEDYVDQITKSKIVIRNTSIQQPRTSSSAKKSAKSAEKVQTESANNDQLVSELIENIEKQNKDIEFLKKQNEKLNLQIERQNRQIQQMNLQIQQKDEIIQNLNEQIEKNGHLRTQRKSGFQSRDLRSPSNPFEIRHSSSGDDFSTATHFDRSKADLMNQISEIENKMGEEEKMFTNGKKSFSNYDKPRLEYLNDYIELQNEARRRFPDTKRELNQRISNFLKRLYVEKQKEERNSAFMNRIMSGLGSYNSGSKVEVMIQRLESYLRKNR